MRTSHHSFEEPAPFDANDPRISETQEDIIDQVGIRLAMLVLCIAGFIAALSVLSTPSFEKCPVLTSECGPACAWLRHNSRAAAANCRSPCIKVAVDLSPPVRT